MSRDGFYGRRMVPEPLLRLVEKLQKAGIDITEQDILDLTNGVLFNGVTAKESVSGKSFAELMLAKQNKLTAGDNITIDEDNVISASGGGSSNIYTYISYLDISRTGESDSRFSGYIVINSSKDIDITNITLNDFINAILQNVPNETTIPLTFERDGDSSKNFKYCKLIKGTSGWYFLFEYADTQDASSPSLDYLQYSNSSIDYGDAQFNLTKIIL